MRRSKLWLAVVVALAAWPLMSGSCVDIMNRSLINGFFDAATPILLEQLEDSLTNGEDAEET